MDNQDLTQAIVVNATDINENQVTQRFAFFDETGTPLELSDLIAKGDKGDTGPAATGDNVLLTGMVAGEAEAVAATDTVNEAIAKLQAQIDALNA